MAGGHRVYVVSGVSEPAVTPQDIAAKKAYLVSLGITQYTQLIVCPQPHAANKAKMLQDNSIELMIDNGKRNVKAAVAEGIASLLLWNSKKN